MEALVETRNLIRFEKPIAKFKGKFREPTRINFLEKKVKYLY